MIDDLTIAYVAIGAARELDRRGGFTGNQCDRYGGELGFVGEVLGLHTLEILDTLPDGKTDWMSVHAYDVAEEYGRQVADAWLGGVEIDCVALAHSLVDEATA